MSVKVFENILELLTLEGAAKKDARNVRDEDLSIIKNAALVTENGRIKWTGERAKLPNEILGKNPEFISLENRTVMPAFVEPHTHLVFAGDRAEEFEWRMQGETYQQIAAKGGGILSTVKQTRAASKEHLLQLAQKRADQFVAQGVTLLEAKSGYGQDLETELKSLAVARQVVGPEMVTTYLGPHSRSPDFPDLEAYTRYICDEILPRIARENLADRVDIYIEKGFYTLELAKMYFEAAAKLGFPITAHVEQLSDFGGTNLALQFKPQSVDHVVYINEQVIRQIASMETTAVLLPASDFYLKMKYPPARKLIDGGGRVALSTDFNPGTSPTQDLSLVGLLARLEMKMSLSEVIVAFTLGGACALGRSGELGSLEPGKRADFIAIKGSYKELFYSVGHHPVEKVWRSAQELPFSKEK